MVAFGPARSCMGAGPGPDAKFGKLTSVKGRDAICDINCLSFSHSQQTADFVFRLILADCLLNHQSSEVPIRNPHLLYSKLFPKPIYYAMYYFSYIFAGSTKKLIIKLQVWEMVVSIHGHWTIFRTVWKGVRLSRSWKLYSGMTKLWRRSLVKLKIVAKLSVLGWVQDHISSMKGNLKLLFFRTFVIMFSDPLSWMHWYLATCLLYWQHPCQDVILQTSLGVIQI